MQESFLSNPGVWVALAFVLFVVLGYKKMGGALVRALDTRAAKIRAELDHARGLREEAEAVLMEYKKRQAEYLKETESMLARAQEDANNMSRQAERDLQEALDTRVKQAVAKIAREEELAIQDVRNHVVDIALAAARATIVSHVGKLPQEDLIRLALSDIERKIH